MAPNYKPEPYTQIAPYSYLTQNHTLNSPHQHLNHDLIPESLVHVPRLLLPESPPHPMQAPVDDETKTDFENFDIIPEEDLQTGDEYEGEN